MPRRIFFANTGRKHMTRFLLAALLFVASPLATMSATGCYQDDPFAKQPDKDEESEWESKDDNGKSAEWSTRAATIDSRSVITSGKAGCPVIMGGSGIFSTDSREQTGSLGFEIRSSTLTALSNDGSHFAVASKLTIRMKLRSRFTISLPRRRLVRSQESKMKFWTSCSLQEVSMW